MEAQVFTEHFDLEDTHWWFRSKRTMVLSLLRRHGALGGPGLDDDLYLDVRILRQEPLQGRPEDRLGRVLSGGDPDGAGWLLAQLAEGRQLRFDLVEPRTDASKQAFATLRVVRLSSRSPSRASSPPTVWLSADWETPSWAAARVKLRSRATARKASRSLRCARAIHESIS